MAAPSPYADTIRLYVSLFPRKPRDWSRIKKKQPWMADTLERDDFKCQKCGRDGHENNGFRLVVHHIDGSRKTGKLNNSPDNLITLCRSCHAIEHGIKKASPARV